MSTTFIMHRYKGVSRQNSRKIIQVEKEKENTVQSRKITFGGRGEGKRKIIIRNSKSKEIFVGEALHCTIIFQQYKRKRSCKPSKWEGFATTANRTILFVALLRSSWDIPKWYFTSPDPCGKGKSSVNYSQFWVWVSILPCQWCSRTFPASWK